MVSGKASGSGGVTHELHGSDKYCNDYGSGGSGDYPDLASCVDFAKKEGGKYFHYNEDYDECYVCASEVFNDSSAGTKVYKLVDAGEAGECDQRWKMDKE